MSLRRPHIFSLAICLAALAPAAGTARAEWRFDPQADKWVHTEAKEMEDEISDAQFERALKAYQAGDASDAESILDDWLEVYRYKRDSQAALFLLGEARMARGHWYEAYEAYEQLLDPITKKVRP